MAELRRQGLTLPEIASRLGVSKQAVHDSLGRLGASRPLRSVPCTACDRMIYSAFALPAHREKVLCLACLRRGPNATFGQRLLALRLAVGLSQRELGRRAGVSDATIANHEHGAHGFDEATRAKLARVLGHELLGVVRHDKQM
jgi:transcriptional regulator with XRE-family HTH domain